MNLIRILCAVCMFSFSTGVLKAGDADIDTLSQWFAGSFTNIRQANADSTVQAMNLVITPLWRERTDGQWFIAEMTTADSAKQSVGTNIYRVKRIEEGMIEIIPFGVRDTLTQYSADSAKLASLKQNMLAPRSGCEMYLQSTGTSFFGGTHGMGCAERVGKASYKSTDLNIVLKGLVWTTRTYTADGTEMLTLRFIFDRRK